MIRILISIGVGGIAAVVLYMLARVQRVYIAGGVLGLVLAFLIVALLGTRTRTQRGPPCGRHRCSGYFGPRLEQPHHRSPPAQAGPFQIIYDLALVFGERIAPNTLPSELLGGLLALSVFFIITAISAISQSRPRGSGRSEQIVCSPVERSASDVCSQSLDCDQESPSTVPLCLTCPESQRQTCTSHQKQPVWIRSGVAALCAGSVCAHHGGSTPPSCGDAAPARRGHGLGCLYETICR